VPVGNVYYYFKTKDELVAAVMDAHTREIRAGLAASARFATPRERLRAFTMGLVGDSERTACSGCAHGAICQELAKRDDHLGGYAATLITLTIDWVGEQYRLAGCADARDLAVGLVAAVQGVVLLANSLSDPMILKRQAQRLVEAIDAQLDGATGSSTQRRRRAPARFGSGVDASG
jgi:TetR/AcrR family transcriptional repressor of nem operon